MKTESKLSKEDEASLTHNGSGSGEEPDVRKEDQDRINRFSRLHQREAGIESELKVIEVCGFSYSVNLVFRLPLPQLMQ
jgi:prefoldin subunit 4